MVECLLASLASIHQMPKVLPTPGWYTDHQKCLQTLSHLCRERQYNKSCQLERLPYCEVSKYKAQNFLIGHPREPSACSFQLWILRHRITLKIGAHSIESLNLVITAVIIYTLYYCACVQPEDASQHSPQGHHNQLVGMAPSLQNFP